jgi:hypothetical protein
MNGSFCFALSSSIDHGRQAVNPNQSSKPNPLSGCFGLMAVPLGVGLLFVLWLVFLGLFG